MSIRLRVLTQMLPIYIYIYIYINISMHINITNPVLVIVD